MVMSEIPMPLDTGDFRLMDRKVVDALQSGQGTADQLPVTLGTSEESGWVELVEGVLPGTKVILDGDGLNPGDSVHVQKGEV